jgi:hypothetical protein
LNKLQHILILTFLFIFLSSQAQELDNSEVGLIYKREQSMGINLNTDGWGFDYRLGFFKTGYLKRTLDISFSFIRDPKETRYYNSYDQSSKSFIYGKERSFYSLRFLYGNQKDLSNKPYWGGVDIRWLNLFGFNLGIGKPIYLYVVDQANDGVLDLQRYDPARHNLSNIYGRGPYSKGLSELEVFPGISFKTALNVEYGSIPEKTRSIEAGIIFNGYLRPYNIMAYSDQRYFDMSVYLSFNFGKRYNK